MTPQESAHWNELMQKALAESKRQFEKQQTEYDRCVRRAERIAAVYANEGTLF